MDPTFNFKRSYHRSASTTVDLKYNGGKEHDSVASKFS